MGALKKAEADRAAGLSNFTTRDEELTEIIATGEATHKALGDAIEVLRGGAAAASQGGEGFSGTDGLGTIISFLENIEAKQAAAEKAKAEAEEDLTTAKEALSTEESTMDG